MSAGSTRPSVSAISNAGSAAFAEGRIDEAASLYAQAVRALTPEDDEIAPLVYENLGLAWMNQGRLPAATRAFLRALDGRPETRVQSAGFLITCFVQQRRFSDARRLLRVYEATWGTHPEGWSDGTLAAAEAGERAQRARRLVG